MIKLEAVYTLVLVCASLSFSTNVLSETNQAHSIHPSHIKTLAASCAACHGSQGNSIKITPTLAGLSKGYFISQMQAFKTGQQPSTVMHRHAKGLTDEEIVLLADYFSAQKRSTMHVLQTQTLGAQHD
jgi:cytochrome subunit of sulfide dehydrogenase